MYCNRQPRHEMTLISYDLSIQGYKLTFLLEDWNEKLHDSWSQRLHRIATTDCVVAQMPDSQQHTAALSSHSEFALWACRKTWAEPVSSQRSLTLAFLTCLPLRTSKKCSTSLRTDSWSLHWAARCLQAMAAKSRLLSSLEWHWAVNASSRWLANWTCYEN